MLDILKNHPFAVEAFFEQSLVLTFAIQKEELRNRIPACLTLDTFQDKWAFLAIAMVQTKDLRPKGFPEWMGNDFFLIGYRVFVRYKTLSGKNLRGLYILKSETDQKRMAFMGNIFTHYNYTATDIVYAKNMPEIKIASTKSNFEIIFHDSDDEVALPELSPFGSWKEARRFAGPLPFTFTYNSATREVLIIEGVRQNWLPKPVKIKSYDFEFLKSLNLQSLCLANAFLIKDIPYYWKKGKVEQWK